MSGSESVQSPIPASADQVDARAAEFIFRKCDLESWDTDDQVELDTWLSESFAHRVSYWRLEAAWDRADRLTALKLRTRGSELAGPDGRSGRYFKIAAAAVMVAALGFGVWVLFPQHKESTYATAIGDHELLTLADGSRIDLNTNSELRIQRDEGRRIVNLVRGEAFFDVRHDSARPFVVLVAGHRITDIGTKFLVREQQGRVRVAVVEGSAKLEPDTAGLEIHPTVLLPGDVAIATPSSVSVSNRPVDRLQTELSWRHGVLMFHHTPLAEVAFEYNRYNQRQIVIADAKLGALTISAKLPTNDVDAFARMARNFLGLRVQNKAGNIEISR